MLVTETHTSSTVDDMKCFRLELSMVQVLYLNLPNSEPTANCYCPLPTEFNSSQYSTALR